MLFSVYPFRDEGELTSSPPLFFSVIYSKKLLRSGVFEIINRNRAIIEPHRDLVDQVKLNLDNSLRSGNREANDILNNINDLLPGENPTDHRLIKEDGYVSLPNYVSPV